MTDPARVTVTTTRSYEAVDVTELVESLVPSGDGVLIASTPHTTCALFLSEVDDELLRDLEHVGESLLDQFEPLTHARNGIANGAAHIVSSMFGTSVLLSTTGGGLRLGRYQRIVLLELDGPKPRQIELRAVTA